MYSGGTGFSMPSVLPSVPPVAPMSYEQRAETGSGLGMLSSGSLYGYGSLSMGDNGHGSLSSYSSKMYGGLPPPSTFEMVVPAHAVGKVMGKGGANIANIRPVMRPGQIVTSLRAEKAARRTAEQRGLKLQLLWSTMEETSLWELSRQMQARSDDVSTQFLTEDVPEHASITFSLVFTSISTMDLE
ncbi:KH domain-containing protein [Camellia lanceoleosa]|uniref:KH domain-containing protein n=1 Tax=Camellia lanceoleosa TaxID=1840588 RepID=A0ACC0IB35_9ERIC|nr:KH domain-containing protein [Camellia lanceoleosa]